MPSVPTPVGLTLTEAQPWMKPYSNGVRDFNMLI